MAAKDLPTVYWVMNMKIQCVIFDIDNTLYDYDRPHAVAFSVLTAYAQQKLGLSAQEFTELHRTADRLLKKRTGCECAAIHNRLLRYQIMLELSGKPLRHAPCMEQLYWSVLLDTALPSPGAVSCMQQLKDAGVRLGIGTDMTANWQFVKLERLGLLDLVDFMVTSEEVTAEKPSPSFFQLCLEKAGCAPEACAFVGDNLKKDVGGAQAAGMLPIWYHPGDADHAAIPQVHLVRRLDEIPPLLLL